LFRNHPEIKFRGAVHEIVDPTRMHPHLRFGSLPVVLHHYGKVREAERVKFKQHFYLDLGKKKVSEEGANPKAHFDLGIQYQELQFHAEAVECFEKTFEMTRMPIALLYAAISEKQRGNYTRALELLQRASAMKLRIFELHLELGNVYLALNQTQEAIEAYLCCLEIRPENPIALFNLGLAYRKAGDHPEALLYYRRAFDMDPTFDAAALELAILQADSGQQYEAAMILSALIERNPEHRQARLTLAKIYIKASQPAEALATLEPMIGKDAVTRSLMGAALLQQGNVDEAQQHLEWAIKRDRSLIDARINLSIIYSKKGDFRKAERFRLSAEAAVQEIKR